MAKYKFANIKTEIDNPTLVKFKVLYDVDEKSAQVFPVFVDSFGNEFEAQIDEVFTYEKTWEDADIVSFINTELDKISV